MANVITTPNMNLPNPVPGVDPGIDYADNLQSSLNIIDQHNHTAGSGVPIPPQGLNINSDLTFQGNNATNLRTTRFVSQSTTISPASGIDVNCLYVVNGNLYYNDSLGDDPIQITSEGAVNASSSGISRVISGVTAEAAFNASGVLVVNLNQATGEPANIQAQSILLGNASSSTNYTTLESPSSTPTQTLVLPTIPGVSTSLMTLDTSGNIAATTVPDGSTIVISGGQLKIPSGGITSTQIATGTVTQGNLAIRSTGTTVSAGGIAISNSCGSYTTTSGSFVAVTNLSVTITSTGSPIWVGLQADASVYSSWFLNSAGAGLLVLGIPTGGSSFQYLAGYRTTSTVQTALPGLLSIVPLSAGTTTFTVYAETSSPTLNIANAQLVAYEL